MFSLTTITAADLAYSEQLRHSPDSPSLLYCSGNLSLLQQPSIAVVGSRAMTRYGAEVCAHITTDLCQAGAVIVSGLATGVDAAAHRAALASGGKTIAVLANGLSDQRIFPSEHVRLAHDIIAHDGLLISEYPADTPAQRFQFVARNRIIAGLSLATVVIEARPKSGALVTARFALEANREVFAVPGSIFSTRSLGTHDLIKQGAHLLQSANDIITELQLPAVTMFRQLQPAGAATGSALSAEADHILQLMTNGYISLEQLLHQTNLSAGNLMDYLTELEITGIVRRNHDYTYTLNQTIAS